MPHSNKSPFFKPQQHKKIRRSVSIDPANNGFILRVTNLDEPYESEQIIATSTRRALGILRQLFKMEDENGLPPKDEESLLS